MHSSPFIVLAVFFFVAEFFLIIKIDDGFHDSQTFLDASRLLNARENPYLDPYFLNSYTLALPFSKYASFFPAPIGSTLWNVINLFGIFFLICQISPSKSLLIKFWTLLLVLATSPARAMFASVQHTGLILGCLTLSLFLVNKGARLQSSSYKVLSGMVAIIPFEFKPQFAIPILLIFLVEHQYRTAFWSWISLTILLHLSVSSHFNMPLDVLWLQRLLGRSEVTTSVNSGDNSFWIIASSAFGYPHFWLLIGFLAYAISLAALLKFVNLGMSPWKPLLVGALTPLALPYVHTYDYLIICVIVATKFFSRGSRHSVNISLILFLLPTITAPSDLLTTVGFSLVIYFGFKLVRAQLSDGEFSWRTTIGVIFCSGTYIASYSRFHVENLRISLLLALGAGFYLAGNNFLTEKNRP